MLIVFIKLHHTGAGGHFEKTFEPFFIGMAKSKMIGLIEVNFFYMTVAKASILDLPTKNSNPVNGHYP